MLQAQSSGSISSIVNTNTVPSVDTVFAGMTSSFPSTASSGAATTVTYTSVSSAVDPSAISGASETIFSTPRPKSEATSSKASPGSPNASNMTSSPSATPLTETSTSNADYVGMSGDGFFDDTTKRTHWT